VVVVLVVGNEQLLYFAFVFLMSCGIGTAAATTLATSCKQQFHKLGQKAFEPKTRQSQANRGGGPSRVYCICCTKLAR